MIEISKQLALKGVDVARSALAKELGYDFFGLIVKIVVYFIVAWFLEGILKASLNLGDPTSLLHRILGSIGGIPIISLPQWVSDLITGKKFVPPVIPDQPSKLIDTINYWTIVKGVGMFLILLEAKNYYELNESQNRKPSPITLGIFALIMILFGFITFPDIVNRISMGSALLGKVNR